MDLREQQFGLELEFTGISRYQAASVLAKHFGVTAQHQGGSYDKYTVSDMEGREWTIMRDSSLSPQKKDGSIASDEYRVEFVTPICKYLDIEAIQEIVREFRAAQAVVNSSCGIHVHVGTGAGAGTAHTVQSIKNLINIVHAHQDLIYKALEVGSGRSGYCKKLESDLVDRAKSAKQMDRLADIWYRGSGCRTAHYNDSRYHILNLILVCIAKYGRRNQSL